MKLRMSAGLPRCSFGSVAAAACCLMLSPPAGAADAAARDALREHRLIWSAVAIDDYEYGYNKFCECHREAPPETLVTVRDGEVVGVRHRHADTDTVVDAEQRNFEWYWTVEGLFDLVDTALEREVEVRADYDPALGYPTRVYIDYDPNLIGEELDVRLTRLERLEP
ncbi:MAG: hypothetical protein JXB36_08235 [Gammaproteobacteria bacterium]|nr:hypothetical protein [Gammaproteobacteria bacterium]